MRHRESGRRPERPPSPPGDARNRRLAELAMRKLFERGFRERDVITDWREAALEVDDGGDD